MGSFKVEDLEDISTRVELHLNTGFIDGSNPFTPDVVHTVGSEQMRFRTNVVNGDDGDPDTTVARMMFVRRLTSAYLAGTGFTVEPVAHNSRAIATHSKIDCVVRKLGANGVATGSDLCTTGEITMSGVTTATQQSFAVDGTTLVVGDRVAIEVTMSLNDTGAAGSSPDAFGYLDRVDVVGPGKGGLPWME